MMLATIQQLREISQCCLNGGKLDSDQARWLGDSLDKFLSHRARTIEDAMGLRAVRGGVPWWLEEAIRKRDHALRAAAEKHFPNCPVSAQATALRSIALRYAASTWRFDRQNDAMPSAYAGTLMECVWRAFKSGAPMPISTRQLRNILAR